ncbi:MAG: hypothetical protein ACXVA2_20215 [Mucilaginibacter sp.]
MEKTMSWHCITLSRQAFESGELNILVRVFHAAYVAKGGPEGMAMFGCWADDACYFVYFTPKSVRYILPLLDAYSAKQIDAPIPSGIDLIYGDESIQSCFQVEFEA